MADENQAGTQPNQANGEDTQPVFQIQRVYLKDLSLEQPNSPAIFLEQEPPVIEVAVDVGATALANNIFESTVTITVTSKIGDKVAFLVEGKQAGIFEARNIPADQLDPLLGIACPNIIYPYLRANIADIITRSGFPPVHLSEINFEVFYQQRLAAAEQAQGQIASPDTGLVMPDGSPATTH
ncbi:MAG: protein-export chaperone SecB [Herbaspirillum sp.]